MSETTSSNVGNEEMLRMVADIVAAYVSFNNIASQDISDLIKTVHGTLNGVSGSNLAVAENAPKPAVAIRKSVHPDYLICLEDGRKLKMLKRYLRTRYNMTPEEYRAKWGLPPDYPMVAPNYSTQRSSFAKKIGLGRRRTTG